MHSVEKHSPGKFYAATPDDYDELTELWEASVRETHDFLTPEDVAVIKREVREKYLPAMDKIVYTCDGAGIISAFAGIAGDKMEMLFVLPKYIGQSIGKRLFMHAVFEMKVTRLDVNEQNASAVGFYLRQGCRVVGRSAVDAMGRPFPILHMKCLFTE